VSSFPWLSWEIRGFSSKPWLMEGKTGVYPPEKNWFISDGTYPLKKA
jgi:hypothetical protein